MPKQIFSFVVRRLETLSGTHTHTHTLAVDFLKAFVRDHVTRPWRLSLPRRLMGTLPHIARRSSSVRPSLPRPPSAVTLAPHFTPPKWDFKSSFQKKVPEGSRARIRLFAKFLGRWSYFLKDMGEFCGPRDDAGPMSWHHYQLDGRMGH